MRKEISKSSKVYFWDLGLRNALIDDFRELDSRRDLGIANETVLPVISSYAFDAYGQNIDGITYQLFDRLKISMNVPLLADVLSFKTENALYKFISQGPSSFFAEPISWQTNGFLAPAIFLSIVTAVFGSIIITVLLFKEGSQFVRFFKCLNFVPLIISIYNINVTIEHVTNFFFFLLFLLNAPYLY